MKTSDYIMKFLYDMWSDTIFSFSWWMITHLEDSAYLNKKIKLISVRHEQWWAFAAEWFSRSSDKIWIAMWTSWPWATNMITWIASAYFDSIPVIYITWQVNTCELTKNHQVRQTWFQETDIVSMVQNITKFSYQIKDISEVKYVLERAFFLASHWRKWPVLIDIPMNIQRSEIDVDGLVSYYDSEEYKKILNEDKNREKLLSNDVNITFKELQNSKKPIILIWWWCRQSWVRQILSKVVKNLNVPVVCSLQWLDVFSHKEKNYIWMIWVHWNRYANIALMNSDLVLVLWSRLDIRQTWALRDKFCSDAKIIHVDIDGNELWYNVKHTYKNIHQDLHKFLEILSMKEFKNNKIRNRWLDKINRVKSLLIGFETKEKDNWYYNMNYLFEKFSECLPKKSVMINDIWENQMRSSQSLNLWKNQQLLNCWWMWAMWFSLPAAIGAYFANSKSKIVSINWDWWFQLNIQELETISLHKIPLLIIILNNESLWMVKEFQNAYMEWRNIWTVIWYSCPDLKKIAAAFWLKYFKIWKGAAFKKIFNDAISQKSPIILDVKVSKTSKVVPKMMFWNSLDNQAPELPENIKNKISDLLHSN